MKTVIRLVILFVAVVATNSSAESGRLLGIKGVTRSEASPNTVMHRCLTPHLGSDHAQPGLRGIPRSPLALAADTTIRCLVLRVEFLPESPDNPNTTGLGRMDLRRPYFNPIDSARYYDSVGHWIDPPPHDSLYFNAHMRALRQYWKSVSKGKIDLSWDIFPPGADSVYRLPRPMSAYGKCDFADVVGGLVDFTRDALVTADSAHLKIPGHPNINFSNYDAVFLFHAGSDRQNDIGFPETCQDLFTGFIRLGDSDRVAVDNGTTIIESALMMPETANQDNRATALNAVLAHEFGHQLGLPDIYSTRGFLSQLGDFELMDNNGFGTGVDFNFDAGNSFGTVPVYPSAWCRSYLGLDPVIDVRSGSNIQVFGSGTNANVNRIYRVPISETEYYLIENRVAEVDQRTTFLLLDSATNVILGPVDSTKTFSGEYDFLIPGEGLAIYYVDESVASEDRNGNGFSNYQENQLQIVDQDEPRRFLSLVEADGIQNFGGFYRSGFGKPEDLFREDRNRNFTPTSNPPSRTQSGTATGIRVTAINRIFNTEDQIIDSIIEFNVSIERRTPTAPIRVGRPTLALSPIAADLDGDGLDEVLVAAGRRLSVFDFNGRSFLDRVDSCASCLPVLDSAGSDVFGWSVFNDPASFRVPRYADLPSDIIVSPVVGTFGSGPQLTAVGYPVADTGVPSNGRVRILAPTDANNDGQADIVDSLTTDGWPRALYFGTGLWVATDAGELYYKSALGVTRVQAGTSLDSIQGIVQLGSGLGVLSVNAGITTFRTFSASNNFASVNAIPLPHRLTLGPVAGDIDADGDVDLYLFSVTGEAVHLNIDTSGLPSLIGSVDEKELNQTFTTNPVLADLDNDNRIEVVIGGEGMIHAYTPELVRVENFPRLLNEKFRDQELLAAPIVAQMSRGGSAEVAATYQTGSGSQAGALYLMNERQLPGFPYSVGRITAGLTGSPVFMSSPAGGRLGIHGADGWFYSLAVDSASTAQFWPMYGQNASGSFTADPAANGSGSPRTATEISLYAYENPTLTGQTTLRYSIPSPGSARTLTIFDLAGKEIVAFPVEGNGGETREVIWDCSQVPPGVYRAVLEFDLAGSAETAYTDIAVLR